MKRLWVVVSAVMLAACGGTSAGGTNGSGNSTTGASAANGAGNGSANGSASATTSASTSGTSGSGSGSGSSGAASSAASSGSGSTSGGSNGASTGGACYSDGAYVGVGNDAMCCSTYANASGYCAEPVSTGSATTGTGSTTGTTGTATGTTTGGTCPSNVPNLVTGEGGYNAGACDTTPSHAACPKGYHCNDSGQCVLNSSSTLQVTLSFDNIEDFDLHLMEPLGDGGYCEIYYGNPGTDPDAGPLPLPPGFGDAGFGGGQCTCQFGFCFGDCDGGSGFTAPTSGNACPVGWLDLDTNAACGGNDSEGGAHPDGVNVENILFPSFQQPPSGTYYVRVDYWENCDSATCSSGQDSSACGGGHPSSDLSVQVRLPNSAIYQYCPAISESGQGPNDQGQNGGSFPDGAGAGSGFLVTSFTIP